MGALGPGLACLGGHAAAGHHLALLDVGHDRLELRVIAAQALEGDVCRAQDQAVDVARRDVDRRDTQVVADDDVGDDAQLLALEVADRHAVPDDAQVEVDAERLGGVLVPRAAVVELDEDVAVFGEAHLVKGHEAVLALHHHRGVRALDHEAHRLGLAGVEDEAVHLAVLLHTALLRAHEDLELVEILGFEHRSSLGLCAGALEKTGTPCVRPRARALLRAQPAGATCTS